MESLLISKIWKLVSGLGKKKCFFQLWVISKTFCQGRGGQEDVSTLVSMPTPQITFHGGKGKIASFVPLFKQKSTYSELNLEEIAETSYCSCKDLSSARERNNRYLYNLTSNVEGTPCNRLSASGLAYMKGFYWYIKCIKYIKFSVTNNPMQLQLHWIKNVPDGINSFVWRTAVIDKIKSELTYKSVPREGRLAMLSLTANS